MRNRLIFASLNTLAVTHVLAYIFGCIVGALLF